MHRWPLWAMIPVNLLLVVWVWIGRIVFGVGGWFMLFLLPVAAVLAVALLVTTILSFTQHGRALTGVQYAAQVGTWLGMLGFGAFMPDFGDTEESYVSLLTNAFGYSDSLMSTSWLVTMAFGILAAGAYVVLLVALIAGRRRAPSYATV